MWFVPLSLPLFLPLCWHAGISRLPPRAPPPPDVAIVTVAPHDVGEPYEFVGQVEPFRRVDVRSRVEGVVLERPFTEGTVVTQGQVLYRLDRVKYEAAYQKRARPLRQCDANDRAPRTPASQACGGPARCRQCALRA